MHSALNELCVFVPCAEVTKPKEQTRFRTKPNLPYSSGLSFFNLLQHCRKKKAQHRQHSACLTTNCICVRVNSCAVVAPAAPCRYIIISPSFEVCAEILVKLSHLSIDAKETPYERSF